MVQLTQNRSNSDPIYWQIHDTSLTLRLTDYGYEIQQEELFLCLIDVYDEIVIELISGHGDHPLGQEDVSWHEGRAEIYIENLGPGQSRLLRWSTLASVLSAIASFSHQYRYASASFDILDRDHRMQSIGGGYVGALVPPASLKKVATSK